MALVRSAARDLERAGRTVVYYKMDSTLRGNWPEELQGLDSLLRPARVLVCPAFPARGRFIRDGRLELRKHLLPGSARATRGSGNLRHLLRKRLDHLSCAVPLEVIRRGQKAVRAAIESANSRYIVFDATREADLELIGRAFRHSQERLLWAGSAGLACHVLPRLGRPEPAAAPTPERPWLLIQGSRQRISHDQFRRLESDDAVLSIRFHKQAGQRDLDRWYDLLLKALAARRHVALTVPRNFGVRVPNEFARFLRRLLRGLQRRHRLGGVFVSGGATAESVCDVLRVSAVQVIGEVSPGIAWSTLLDGNRPGLPLITKAGGFGRTDEVREILKKIST